MKTASTIAAMLIASSTLLACGGGSQPAGNTGAMPTTGQKKQGEVIATVGKDTITVDDFQAKMEEQSPFIRARYTSLERKKDFLDNMVRFEVLAQEAARRGLQNDPDVIATMKKVMVQKLMRAEFDENEAAGEVSEAELRAFYEENLGDYVKPERVRASHIFLSAPTGSANRAKVKADATRLLADIRAREAGPLKTAFAESAKARTEDAATRLAGGDLLFKTREELARLWGEQFTEAVFGIKTIGEIGALVETDKGFHLVKLTGRQNALDRSFDQVKGNIQSRLFREKRTKSFEEFVAQLKEQAKVQINEDVLARIEVVPAGDAAAGMQPAPAGAAVPVNAPAAPAEPEESARPVPAKAPVPAGAVKPQPAQLKGANGKVVPLPAGVKDIKELKLPRDLPAPAPKPASN